MPLARLRPPLCHAAARLCGLVGAVAKPRFAPAVPTDLRPRPEPPQAGQAGPLQVDARGGGVV
eukprot:15190262-Alexandrium_andersonii.AAC.1